MSQQGTTTDPVGFDMIFHHTHTLTTSLTNDIPVECVSPFSYTYTICYGMIGSSISEGGRFWGTVSKSQNKGSRLNPLSLL